MLKRRVLDSSLEQQHTSDVTVSLKHKQQKIKRSKSLIRSLAQSVKLRHFKNSETATQEKSTPDITQCPSTLGVLRKSESTSSLHELTRSTTPVETQNTGGHGKSLRVSNTLPSRSHSFTSSRTGNDVRCMLTTRLGYENIKQQLNILNFDLGDIKKGILVKNGYTTRGGSPLTADDFYSYKTKQQTHPKYTKMEDEYISTRTNENQGYKSYNYEQYGEPNIENGKDSRPPSDDSGLVMCSPSSSNPNNNSLDYKRQQVAKMRSENRQNSAGPAHQSDFDSPMSDDIRSKSCTPAENESGRRSQGKEPLRKRLSSSQESNLSVGSSAAEGKTRFNHDRTHTQKDSQSQRTSMDERRPSRNSNANSPDNSANTPLANQSPSVSRCQSSEPTNEMPDRPQCDETVARSHDQWAEEMQLPTNVDNVDKQVDDAKCYIEEKTDSLSNMENDTDAVLQRDNISKQASMSNSRDKIEQYDKQKPATPPSRGQTPVTPKSADQSPVTTSTRDKLRNETSKAHNRNHVPSQSGDQSPVTSQSHACKKQCESTKTSSDNDNQVQYNVDNDNIATDVNSLKHEQDPYSETHSHADVNTPSLKASQSEPDSLNQNANGPDETGSDSPLKSTNHKHNTVNTVETLNQQIGSNSTDNLSIGNTEKTEELCVNNDHKADDLQSAVNSDNTEDYFDGNINSKCNGSVTTVGEAINSEQSQNAIKSKVSPSRLSRKQSKHEKGTKVIHKLVRAIHSIDQCGGNSAADDRESASPDNGATYRSKNERQTRSLDHTGRNEGSSSSFDAHSDKIRYTDAHCENPDTIRDPNSSVKESDVTPVDYLTCEPKGAFNSTSTDEGVGNSGESNIKTKDGIAKSSQEGLDSSNKGGADTYEKDASISSDKRRGNVSSSSKVKEINDGEVKEVVSTEECYQGTGGKNETNTPRKKGQAQSTESPKSPHSSVHQKQNSPPEYDPNVGGSIPSGSNTPVQSEEARGRTSKDNKKVDSSQKGVSGESRSLIPSTPKAQHAKGPTHESNRQSISHDSHENVYNRDSITTPSGDSQRARAREKSETGSASSCDPTQPIRPARHKQRQGRESRGEGIAKRGSSGQEIPTTRSQEGSPSLKTPQHYTNTSLSANCSPLHGYSDNFVTQQQGEHVSPSQSATLHSRRDHSSPGTLSRNQTHPSASSQLATPDSTTATPDKDVRRSRSQYEREQYAPMSRGYALEEDERTTTSTRSSSGGGEVNQIFQTIRDMQSSRTDMESENSGHFKSRDRTPASSRDVSRGVSPNQMPRSRTEGSMARNRGSNARDDRHATSGQTGLRTDTDSQHRSRAPTSSKSMSHMSTERQGRHGQYSPMAQALLKTPSNESFAPQITEMPSLLQDACFEKFFPKEMVSPSKRPASSDNYGTKPDMGAQYQQFANDTTQTLDRNMPRSRKGSYRQDHEDATHPRYNTLQQDTTAMQENTATKEDLDDSDKFSVTGKTAIEILEHYNRNYKAEPKEAPRSVKLPTKLPHKLKGQATAAKSPLREGKSVKKVDKKGDQKGAKSSQAQKTEPPQPTPKHTPQDQKHSGAVGKDKQPQDRQSHRHAKSSNNEDPQIVRTKSSRQSSATPVTPNNPVIFEERPMRKPPSTLNVKSAVDELLRKQNPLPLYDGDPYLQAGERQIKERTPLPSQMGRYVHTAGILGHVTDASNSDQLSASAHTSNDAIQAKHLLDKLMPLGELDEQADADYQYVPSYVTSEMSIALTETPTSEDFRTQAFPSQISLTDSMSSVSTPVKTLVQGNFMQCGICFESYLEPKLLSCGHTFCRDCIDRTTTGEGEDQVFFCPFCASHYSMPPEGAVELNDDAFVLALVREAKRGTRQEMTRREECVLCVAGESAQATCLDCRGAICLDCMKVHNKIKMFVDHTVVTFDYLASMRKTIVDEISATLNKLHNTTSTISGGAQVVQNYISSVHKKESETIAAIEERAKLLIENITTSANAMKKQVKDNANDRIGELQNLLDDCLRALDTADTLHRQLQALGSFKTRDLQPYRCVRGQVLRVAPRLYETCSRVKNMQYPTVKQAGFVRGQYTHWPTAANALLGFLTPQTDRQKRRVEIYDTQGLFEKQTLAEYTVSCCHDALDKYVSHPRNNITYAYVAAYVTHQLHVEFPGHEFHCIVGNNYNFSISKGDCIVVVIDDFDITVYTNSKTEYNKHRVTPQQPPHWLSGKSSNQDNN